MRLSSCSTGLGALSVPPRASGSSEAVPWKSRIDAVDRKPESQVTSAFRGGGGCDVGVLLDLVGECGDGVRWRRCSRVVVRLWGSSGLPNLIKVDRVSRESI